MINLIDKTNKAYNERRQNSAANKFIKKINSKKSIILMTTDHGIIIISM
jgi:hypothetical protein